MEADSRVYLLANKKKNFFVGKNGSRVNKFTEFYYTKLHKKNQGESYYEILIFTNQGWISLLKEKYFIILIIYIKLFLMRGLMPFLFFYFLLFNILRFQTRNICHLKQNSLVLMFYISILSFILLVFNVIF